MKKIKDLETALAIFKEAANNHAESSATGEYKITNSNYKIIDKAFEYIRDNGKLMELKPLLSHSSVGVRSWSAFLLLPILEQDAIKVIEDIANDKTIDWQNSFSAEKVLEGWRDGDMKTWLIPKVLGVQVDEIK